MASDWKKLDFTDPQAVKDYVEMQEAEFIRQQQQQQREFSQRQREYEKHSASIETQFREKIGQLEAEFLAREKALIERVDELSAKNARGEMETDAISVPSGLVNRKRTVNDG